VPLSFIRLQEDPARQSVRILNDASPCRPRPPPERQSSSHDGCYSAFEEIHVLDLPMRGLKALTNFRGAFQVWLSRARPTFDIASSISCVVRPWIGAALRGSNSRTALERLMMLAWACPPQRSWVSLSAIAPICNLYATFLAMRVIYEELIG
jgi:hypothetical protein